MTKQDFLIYAENNLGEMTLNMFNQTTFKKGSLLITVDINDRENGPEVWFIQVELIAKTMPAYHVGNWEHLTFDQAKTLVEGL